MNKIAHILVVAGIYALGTACNDSSGTDPVETGLGETDSDTTVESDTPEDTDTTPSWDTTAFVLADVMSVDCPTTETGTVTFTIRSDNWGYTPELYIADTRFTQNYDETHTLEEVGTSPDPTGYSEFSRTLAALGAFPNTPDVNTVFGCSDFDATSGEYQVTAALALYDDAGALADCIVFGQDADLLIGGTLTEISEPSWLNSTNCRVVE